MPNISPIDYSNDELITLVLQNKGINEGHWALSVKFAFSAMNIGQLPDGSDASPAGVVAVKGFRIERVPEPLPFSVNAAEVNPKK